MLARDLLIGKHHVARRCATDRQGRFLDFDDPTGIRPLEHDEKMPEVHRARPLRIKGPIEQGRSSVQATVKRSFGHAFHS